MAIKTIEHKKFMRMYKNGTISIKLAKTTMSNSSTLVALNIRLERSSDKKVYKKTFTGLEICREIKCADPMLVQEWLANMDRAIDLGNAYVLVFYRKYWPLAVFTIREEIDQLAVYQKQINHLTEEIAQLKRKHAADMAAVRAEYAAFTNIRESEDDDECDEPQAKKFRPANIGFDGDEN